MNNAYKKECWVALIAFGVVTFLTHIFPIYFLFPQITEFTILGFPAHYLITIIVGWLLLIPLYWVYISISEKVDEEIAETTPFAVLEEQERARAAAEQSPAAAQAPTSGGAK
jgi:putative solute:sodium symporter small subunit